MSEAQSVDIVIAGAGMVGVTLAAALAPSGLNIVLLEQREGDLSGFPVWVREQQAQGYDPRVSALTCASQQILTSVGAWDKMLQYRVSPYTHMDVWDGEGTGHIHFSAQELHEPCLGHIVENRVTLAALYEVLEELSNVHVLTGASLKEMGDANADGRVLTLHDGRLIYTKLLVAADGALSRTRQMAAIPMMEWDYGHHAIVTTIRTERPHQHTCWQRFTDDGPLAVLPLYADDNSQTSSIVWSTSPDHASDLMALDDDAFAAELARSFEQRLGAVEWVDQRHMFPLRQRHAKFYVCEGFAAIGDAAHTIHPLAGQGVNLGLLDAAALAETLLDAQERGEFIGSEQVLRRFQRARQSDNIQMSAAMEGFKRLFNSSQPGLRLMRNIGMNLMDRLAPVKNHIVMDAMGLRGNLPKLARRPIRS